jgi:flagellar hook-associated protein 1
MKSLQTGVTSALSGAGTAASPLVGEGLSLVVSGSASVGDSFLVKPTSGAVDGMSLLLNDPALVAAAAPIIGEADADNTGSAMISQGVVTDAGNASLLTTVTIEFLSATTYTTDGGATTNTYTSGQSISLNGWSVTLTGQPATGDVFTVSSNSSGSGDNRNALLMANLLDQDYLNGGTTSVNDALGNWVADLGVKSNSANANYEAQSAVYDDASSALQSVSGVNLDEEAANLVRYQQAYAAMAKVISTSNELFNTLLDAFN